MRRSALALAVVAAVALAADFAVASESSHRGAAQASLTLVAHHGHSGHYGRSFGYAGRGHGYYGRSPHYYHHGGYGWGRTIYRYPSAYPYPYSCRRYPYGGFYYGTPRFGFSFGF